MTTINMPNLNELFLKEHSENETPVVEELLSVSDLLEELPHVGGEAPCETAGTILYADRSHHKESERILDLRKRIDKAIEGFMFSIELAFKAANPLPKEEDRPKTKSTAPLADEPTDNTTPIVLESDIGPYRAETVVHAEIDDLNDATFMDSEGKVHVIGKAHYRVVSKSTKWRDLPIEELTVTDGVLKKLADAGYTDIGTLYDVYAKRGSLNGLVKGIGPATADKVVTAIRQVTPEWID